MGIVAVISAGCDVDGVTPPDADPPDADPLDADAGPNIVVATDRQFMLSGTAAGGAPPFVFRWSLEQQPDGADVTLEERTRDQTLVVEEGLPVEGAYVFRVRVTDSSGESDTSFTTVTVGGGLTVQASSDAVLRVLAEPAQLDVTFESDDVDPIDPTFSWEVVRGAAEFNDATAANPQVTLQSADTVELRVTVTADSEIGLIQESAEVIIVGVSDATPEVVIENTGGVEGDIVLELLTEDAPATVANFLRYVDDGFFDGIVWHRVVSGFVIQGGAFEREGDMLVRREGVRPPVMSEAPNGQSNVRGTVAMALQGMDANSGTNQFFVNVQDNANLDTGPPPFTVFARVIEGIDVVDQIDAVMVGDDSGLNNVPVEDVVMNTVRRR